MNDDALKQIPKFKYLVSIFTEDGKNKEDIHVIQRINPYSANMENRVSS